MSPDQIPQKEGEPASEKIAQAEQLVAAYVPGLRLGTLIFGQEDLVALHNLLADAKGRAVAQEAEGRRLREAGGRVQAALQCHTSGHGLDCTCADCEALDFWVGVTA